MGRRLRRRAEGLVGRHDGVHDMLGVAPGQVPGPPGCREAVGGVGPHGGQHPEPGSRSRGVGDEQGALGQAAQRIERRRPAGDGGDVVDLGQAGEDRQVGEEGAVFLVQEVLRPRHDRGQRLVPGLARATSGPQDVEPVVEKVGQFGQRDRRRSRRGHLHGERQAVEAGHDPRHRSACPPESPRSGRAARARRTNRSNAGDPSPPTPRV